MKQQYKIPILEIPTKVIPLSFTVKGLIHSFLISFLSDSVKLTLSARKIHEHGKNYNMKYKLMNITLIDNRQMGKKRKKI